MSNNTGIKKQILKELAKNKAGLTNFELSEKLGLTKQQVNDSLRESSATNYVSKGENLGAEGINYTISNAGLSYLKRNGEKSPLTQNEKTPVETVEATPIVEESPLEQKLPNDWVSQVVEEITVTEIEDFETRAIVTESELPVKNLNPELFELVKIIDENNAKIYELFTKKPKQIIFNRENKINELHKICSAGILGNRTVSILTDIISDLQAA
jgi:Winged helix-turn-helix DNA-binding